MSEVNKDIQEKQDEPGSSSPVNEVNQVNEIEKWSTHIPPRTFCTLPFSFFKDGLTFDQIFDSEGKARWVTYSSNGSQQLLDEKQAGIPFTVTSSEDVTLASGLGRSQSGEELVARIEKMLLRVHQFKLDYEAEFLSHYCLATWTYDNHPYVGYAAFSGLPGSNKSGLLFALQWLVYAGFKISGSATDAVIFRRIHATRGTFIQDEAQQDFEKSSSRIHKILTEGNAFNGFVEVAVPTKNGEYVPKKFAAYGPKIFACRELPDDDAILSRTTEFNLPVLAEDPCLEKFTDERWKADARMLQNDLLLYRQRKRVGDLPTPAIDYEPLLKGMKLTGRERQVYEWILRECPSVQSLRSLQSLITAQRMKLIGDRMQLPEIIILMTCLDLNLPASFQAIATAVSLQGTPVTARAVGKAVRRNHLEVIRRNSGPVLVATLDDIHVALTRLGIPPAAQDSSKGGS